MNFTEKALKEMTGKTKLVDCPKCQTPHVVGKSCVWCDLLKKNKALDAKLDNPTPLTGTVNGKPVVVDISKPKVVKGDIAHVELNEEIVEEDGIIEQPIDDEMMEHDMHTVSQKWHIDNPIQCEICHPFRMAYTTHDGETRSSIVKKADVRPWAKEILKAGIVRVYVKAHGRFFRLSLEGSEVDQFECNPDVVPDIILTHLNIS